MSAALTLSDKIIAAHAIDPPSDDGSPFRRVRVDAVLGHDATIALLIDEFDRRELAIWDPSRVLFTNDHFSPPSTVEAAEISNAFRAFARRHGVNVMLDRGICHQLLVEHQLCRPGALIVGADSHTTTGGALGACATGMGSTDVLYTLATGTTWLRRPETIRVRFVGTLPAGCSGRDVVLSLLSCLGESGAQYRTLEFLDHAEPRLRQHDRFAISNMAVELGAKFGLFVPDEITLQYCTQRDGRPPEDMTLPDPDATYAQEIEFDLTSLAPLIARPWTPGNVVPISALQRQAITVAFLGSCSNGRLEDLRDAAEEVAGRTVHPDVRFIVIPASQAIFSEALRAGYVQTLVDAGAVVNQSSCGPCGGIDKGVLGATDVCVSTSNRNFRGRMGHWDSRTYLAGARTVARAALLGYLGPDLFEEQTL